MRLQETKKVMYGSRLGSRNAQAGFHTSAPDQKMVMATSSPRFHNQRQTSKEISKHIHIGSLDDLRMERTLIDRPKPLRKVKTKLKNI